MSGPPALSRPLRCGVSSSGAAASPPQGPPHLPELSIKNYEKQLSERIMVARTRYIRPAYGRVSLHAAVRNGSGLGTEAVRALDHAGIFVDDVAVLQPSLDTGVGTERDMRTAGVGGVLWCCLMPLRAILYLRHLAAVPVRTGFCRGVPAHPRPSAR